jgi:hypothetical protein
MPLGITNHDAVSKNAYFLDVATLFDIEHSCFNFEVHMMCWLCDAKLERSQGIDFKKFEVLGIASVPLLKLGRGTKQRTIA